MLSPITTLSNPTGPSVSSFEHSQAAYGPYVSMGKPIVSTILVDKSPSRIFKTPKEAIITQNLSERIKDDFHEVFVQLPKTVIRGLNGSSNFSFADKMKLANIPYYLGGAFLCLSYIAGRDFSRGSRQLTAVLFYLVGLGVTHKLIDSAYKLRYGIDLNLRYRTLNGGKEKVFASSDFPRFDLFTPEHYEKYARGFHIPVDTNDTQGAVNQKLKEVINQSRVLKIILGNLSAAFGAGYFAQTKNWRGVIQRLGVIPMILREKKLTLGEKFSSSWMTATNVILDPLVSRMKPRAMGTSIILMFFATSIFALVSLYQTLKLRYKKTNNSVETQKLQHLIEKNTIPFPEAHGLLTVPQLNPMFQNVSKDTQGDTP